MDLPERILSGAAGDWERSVLESATLDAPSPEFKHAFAHSLGVALGSASVLTVGGTSHAALSATWLKWLAVGFVVGTAGATTGAKLADWQMTESAKSAPETKAMTRHALGQRQQSALVASAAPSASEQPAPPPATPSVMVAPVSAVLASAPLSTGVRAGGLEPGEVQAPSLRAEMTQLEAARSALAHGDTRSALQQLDDFEAHHALGALRIEARVLRIEALSASGDRQAARSLAQRFLAQQPDSPYAKRIVSIANSSRESNR